MGGKLLCRSGLDSRLSPLADVGGARAVSLLGTASVGWLRSEVDMARIIDAARGAPAWVSAPLLLGTPTDSSARVIALTQPSVVPILCPCSTRLVGRSAGRVVDQDDANLPPTPSVGEWPSVGNLGFEEPSHDHPR